MDNAVKIARAEAHHYGKITSILKDLTNKLLNPAEIRKRLLNENLYCFIAFHKGKAVGTGTIVFYETLTKGIIGRIEDVIVVPEEQSRGIGDKIMERLLYEAKYKKCAIVELTSNPRRAAAQKLYLKKGFKKHHTNVFRMELEYC